MTMADREIATLAGGCFWCLEAVYKDLAGIDTVVSGYMGGHVDNPTYRQVCGGDTGHAEVVQIAFDPSVITYDQLLDVFFTIHDPTQLNRQGNDIGTQYRSVIYTNSDSQMTSAEQSKSAYQGRLDSAGYGAITTELAPAGRFYYAEEYHQQYLAKNPGGYCGIGGTGVSCPTGIAV